jgi:hypothetical protein
MEELEPRILLTGPQIFLTPTVLASLVQEAQANTPQWAAFKAYLDANLAVVNQDAYEASELTDISNYALGYQVLKNIDPLTAANYADKAIGLMKSGLNDYQIDASVSRQFLARGDGVTTSFVLPNTDLIPSSLTVYLSNVTTVPIVRGVANTQDSVGYYLKFLKVSNTSDGNPDYVQGVDWTHNPNLDDSLIDWSLGGKEPVSGATYYVTYTDGIGGSPVAFTLNGHTITFAAAPSKGQAVYVQYIYGTHSADGSTLAYQQTSAGDGGFNSIFKDDTYTSRYLGKHLAMGLDWLDGYVGLSPTFRSQVIAMLIRWFDYVQTNGYYNNSPTSNYGAGGYDSMVLTGLAVLNRDPAGPTLMSEALAYRQANLIPALQGPNSYQGGFWAEGWNYGALAAQNDILAGLALESAGQIPTASVERAWASQAVRSLISEQPTKSTIYDGGDWYTYPSPFPGNALISILSAAADDPTASSYANYILQTNPSNDTHDYIDLLFRNPAAPGSFWGSFPLQYLADGTGLETARADWNYNSTWMSFQLGNLVQADHQTASPGQLQIQRGADDLLINANAIGENQTSSTKSSFANLIAINSNGDGSQNYPWNMGFWYGTPGVFITNYEAANGYMYIGGDYRAAYSLNTNPGGGGPATQLTRQVIYLRPDLIVVFDRAGTILATYPKQLQWHFLNPAKVNGNSWEEDVGSSKLFGETFSTVPLTTTTYSVNDNGATVYRVATNNTNPILGVRYVTALETAPSTTGSMASSQQIASTDGRMQGVEIGGNVVLFGTNGPLSPFSGSITYTISSATAISHLLTDLQPGQQYVVQANGVVVGTFTSSTQGTLSFTTPVGSTIITVGATAVTPGNASTLMVSGFPSPTTAGVSHSFTVIALDSSSNIASSYLGTIKFSSTDQRAGLPANYTFTPTDAGVHTFSATLITAGLQSITATDTATSAIVGSQAGINVNPAAASTLVVSGYASPTTVGVSHSFTVTARDAFGNKATGYAGIVSFSSTDVKAVLPANYTFSSTDAGVHTFSATFNTAGTQSLSAKDTVVSTISGSQSGITVNPPGVVVPLSDLAGLTTTNGQWWVAKSNGSNGFSNTMWAKWSPLVQWVDVQTGDFTGDGKQDLIARDLQTGNWWVGISTGSSFVTSLWATWNPAANWVDVKIGDFNGDGKDDIAGRYSAGGQWFVGLSTGSSFKTTLWATWSPSADWVDVNVGDFNGNGKSDLTARDLRSGQWWTAISTGSSFTTSLWGTWNPNVPWVDVKVGDFNGDGKDDIAGRLLWYGEWWVAMSTGSSFTNSLFGIWSSEVMWVNVVVGDFNGDGKDDIAGRILQNGQWWVARSTGSSFTNSLFTTWSAADGVTWTNVVVGDFNGDGKDDIAGRILQNGQWWAGLSTGSQFINGLWTTWSTATGWTDVNTGTFT